MATADAAIEALVLKSLQTHLMRDELGSLMKDQSQEPQPLIHPSMARRYREQIENLRKLLTGGQAGEAREHVRGAIRAGYRSLRLFSWDFSNSLTGEPMKNTDIKNGSPD